MCVLYVVYAVLRTAHPPTPSPSVILLNYIKENEDEMMLNEAVVCTSERTASFGESTFGPGCL